MPIMSIHSFTLINRENADFPQMSIIENCWMTDVSYETDKSDDDSPFRHTHCLLNTTTHKTGGVARLSEELDINTIISKPTG